MAQKCQDIFFLVFREWAPSPALIRLPLLSPNLLILFALLSAFLLCAFVGSHRGSASTGMSLNDEFIDDNRKVFVLACITA